MNQNRVRVGLSLSVAIVCIALTVQMRCFAASTAQFTDIPKGHWAAKAVADLASKGIIQSQPGGKFDGEKPLTRYEAALYLDRLVHYMENAHKPLHVSQIPTNKIPKIAPGPAHDAMVYLIKNEFIEASNVIFQAPSSAAVTPTQMTVAATDVVVRLEDRRLPPPTADMDEN